MILFLLFFTIFFFQNSKKKKKKNLLTVFFFLPRNTYASKRMLICEVFTPGLNAARSSAWWLVLRNIPQASGFHHKVLLESSLPSEQLQMCLLDKREVQQSSESREKQCSGEMNQM